MVYTCITGCTYQLTPRLRQMFVRFAPFPHAVGSVHCTATSGYVGEVQFAKGPVVRQPTSFAG